MVLRHCILVVVLSVLVACERGAEPPTAVAKGSRLDNVAVDYVKDGDSFTAFYEGRKIEVRLFGIDAPERGQPYSKESRFAAVKALGNSTLALEVVDRDRYQRVVAEVFLEDQEPSVNQQLVEQGAAWVYRKYSEAPSLISAEERARENRLGIWSLHPSDQVAPWLWRKSNKN